MSATLLELVCPSERENTMEPKKLRRSSTNRMIAGVCGGIADYFGIDPTIVRVLAVLMLLPGGVPGFVPYMLLWLIVPAQPTS